MSSLLYGRRLLCHRGLDRGIIDPFALAELVQELA